MPQKNHSQFSLSTAFLAMTVVSVASMLIMMAGRTTLSESSNTVIWVCVLFIPGVILLFAISTAILISIIAVIQAIARTAVRLKDSAVR